MHVEESLGQSYASRIRIEPNGVESMGKQLVYVDPVSNLPE